MPTDLLKRPDGTWRVDLDLLHPRLVERLLDVVAACRKRGCDYVLTSGTRLWDEQAALYVAYRAGRGGRAAPPGHSAHQFGIAVDLTRDANAAKPGLQPTWADGTYDVLVEEVERAGLHSGHGYNDYPHVSLAGWVTSSDLAPLRRAWQASKGDTLTMLRAVWQVVDQGRLVA